MLDTVRTHLVRTNGIEIETILEIKSNGNGLVTLFINTRKCIIIINQEKSGHPILFKS